MEERGAGMSEDLVTAWNERFRGPGRTVHYWPDGRGKGWGIVTTNVSEARVDGIEIKDGGHVPLDLVTGIGQCADCLAHDMLFYFPACNEEGWRCTACGWKPGEPPGFDPSLDRHLIDTKVGGFVHDLADRDLLSVSNGSHGDGITGSVAAKCREVGRYDQTTILAAIFEADRSHADYWAKISDAIVAGKDERKRCAGGRLVTCYSWRDGEEYNTCFVDGCVCRKDGGSLS